MGAFLNSTDSAHIAYFFAGHLHHPVELLLFGQEEPRSEDPHDCTCDLCEDAATLLGELVSTSPLLSLRECEWNLHERMRLRFDVDKVPAIVLLANGQDTGLRFYGVPSAFEFCTFLDAIASASSGKLELHPETIAQLNTLTAPVQIQVFHTPSCPACPFMTHLCYQFALANPLVECDSVDAMQFPQLAERYGMKAAPYVVINETRYLLGRKAEQELLELVLHAALVPCPVLVR